MHLAVLETPRLVADSICRRHLQERLQTVERSAATSAAATNEGSINAGGGVAVEALGEQVAEGLRRAAGAEGDVTELRRELATMRKLMGSVNQPPATLAAVGDARAARGRQGGGGGVGRTVSDSGAASEDDGGSSGDEI